MKLVYRILTPIFALGSIAMALFLPFFSITVGSTASEDYDKIVRLALYFLGYESSTFELSLFQLIQGGIKGLTDSSEEGRQIFEALTAIKPQLIAFLVLFLLVVLLLLAVAVLSALADSKKKRYTVIGLSAGAMVFSFAAILVSNSAFAKIDQVEVYPFISFFLSEKWAAVLQNETIANFASPLVNGLISITDAALSAGFFAVFGMLLLLILWTILANFICNNPIQRKHSHRRKRPLRSPFASKKA